MQAISRSTCGGFKAAVDQGRVELAKGGGGRCRLREGAVQVEEEVQVY